MKEFHHLRFQMTVELWSRIKAAAQKIGSTATQYIRTAVIEKLNRDRE